MDDRALRDLALRQHGVVTRQQVLAFGGSNGSIQHRIGTGQWMRARPGIYVVGAAPPTWHQRAMAVALATGDDGYLCLRSAARAWGLVDRSGRLQLLVDGQRRVRLAGVEVHRTTRFDSVDAAVIDGLPVTSLPRTLIDLAPDQDAQTMGRLVDTAIRDRGIDVDLIARRIDAVARPGASTPRSLMDALSLRCSGYDPGRSALESRIIAALAAADIARPICQHEVLRPDGRRAFIDLAYPAPLIAIEADGWAFHGHRASFDQDRIRSNELVLMGWSVLRFTSAMPDSLICRVVAQALAGARSAEVGR